MRSPPPELAERLWEVADRALAQGGELRIDELAELTGVPRATLYYYFSGKDDVVGFLLAQQLQRGTDRIAKAVRGRGSAAKRLEAVLRAMLQTMAEHPALCTRLMGGMISDLTGAQLLAEVDRVIMGPVRDLLSEAAEDGELIVHDPSVASLILMGSVSTVALVRTLSGEYDPDATADQLIPQLLNGFRPR